MVFTFFVQSAFSAEFFPEQLKPLVPGSLPIVHNTLPTVQGTLLDDNISILIRSKEPVSVLDMNNNPFSIARDTYLEINSPMDTVRAAYSPELKPNEDNEFFSDLISRISIMKFFSLLEQQQNNSDSSNTERKSERERREVKNLIKAKLKSSDDPDKSVSIQTEDWEKFEVVEQDGLPISIKSDFDGKINWNPEAFEADESKTEGNIPKDCKTCQQNKDNVPVNPAKEIANNAIANKINNLFENNKSENENRYNQQMQKAIDYAMKKKARASTGYCYRFVKNALLDSEVTKPRLGGRYAKNASAELESQGFKNLLNPKHLKDTKLEKDKLNDLLKNPILAPKGAILVYEPNPKNRVINSCNKKKENDTDTECTWEQDGGHIEIKTEKSGKGGYVSDYYNEKARTGNLMATADRKLVGIYYKL